MAPLLLAAALMAGHAEQLVNCMIANEHEADHCKSSRCTTARWAAAAYLLLCCPLCSFWVLDARDVLS